MATGGWEVMADKVLGPSEEAAVRGHHGTARAGGPQDGRFISGGISPTGEAFPLRIQVICGDPECGEEYPTDTRDRFWECPHCGRTIENKYYPFLTAKLMNARIHSDETDWKAQHDELLVQAHGKAADLREHLDLLRKDLRKLRVRLPEEERAKLPDLDAIGGGDGFLEGWSPEAPADDMATWRDLHDRLLEGARGDIISMEEASAEMEDEIRALKSSLNLA